MSTRYNELTTLRVLKAIAETLNRSANLHDTLWSTLPLVVELLDLHTGWLFLSDEQGMFALAAHHNLPPALAYPGDAWCDGCNCQNYSRDGRLRDNALVVPCSRLGGATGDRRGLAFHASVPLTKSDRLLGIMNVATSQWDTFTPEDLQILTAIGFQLATAIERTQLAEQATRVALVEERNRLAREVHDTLAQELAGIALQLEVADALLEAAPAQARARIQQALARTRESLHEARRSVLDLRSGPLEQRDLPTALAELAERFAAENHITITTHIDHDGPRLSARHEQALYRIAQEALANVSRHAQASTVEITLRRAGQQVQLVIADNGRGFAARQSRRRQRHAADPTPSAETQHFGLVSMRERAHMLGGTLQIASAPGAGTRVEAHVPHT
jgi:two-component system NarL family sensor kinase